MSSFCADRGAADRRDVDHRDIDRGDIDHGDGVITGGFTDWHVHLHLIDPSLLAASPLSRVHDLGGDPSELARVAAGGITPAASASASPSGEDPPSPIELLHAGAFLTPPGGYPSDRSWAPADTYREIGGEREARAAVAEMVAAGASAIKVASNAEAGPVFSDEVFRVIVAAAREAGLPVVAHAEGRGEALRAARLGASILAHSPFSERLTAPELTELAATTTWISTLDIHGWGDYGTEHAVAVANVAGFVRAGGRLRYGTDMGNGPVPVGLNPRELDSLAAAGLTPEQVLATLTPADPRPADATRVWVPRDEHGRLDIAAARRLEPPGFA